MSLEIINYLKSEDDLWIAKEVSNDFYGEYDYYNNNSIFAYISSQLVGVLSYEKDSEFFYDQYDVFVHNISVHDKLNYNSKSLGIGSRLIYELINIENGKTISLRATDDSLPFYQKIGFAALDGKKLISKSLSQIKKNLELRLKSPGYLKLTEKDLVRLGIISKNLETVV